MRCPFFFLFLGIVCNELERVLANRFAEKAEWGIERFMGPSALKKVSTGEIHAGKGFVARPACTPQLGARLQLSQHVPVGLRTKTARQVWIPRK
jgi:hypothetical protein